MKGFVRCVLLVPFICLSQPLLYPKDGGGDVSRIFWDAGSLATVFSPGNYCRIIELDDGRLLAAAEACGGISIASSADKGATWSKPVCIAVSPDSIFYAVPDLIQLSDGTVLVGFNPRPVPPYSTDRLFGIRVMRSTDNGATWEGPVFVYDARHTFGDGCWEPSFIELESGEVQCYFADESSYISSNEQCISVCTSLDGGRSWSDPRAVSFRAGSRDGMPVPVVLGDGKTVAVIIEDNGWPGYRNFVATTVRTSVADSWKSGPVHGDDCRRRMIFSKAPGPESVSAAPYLRVLPWGETVASYQGNHSPEVTDLQYFDMFVAVGDSEARKFKSITNPFHIAPGRHSIWNSVSVLDDGTVLAVGSIGMAYGHNTVKIIKGYPVRNIRAVKSCPASGAHQNNVRLPESDVLYLGHLSGVRCPVSFSYDRSCLKISYSVSGSDGRLGGAALHGYALTVHLDSGKSGCRHVCIFKEGPDGLMSADIPWRSLGLNRPPYRKEIRADVELHHNGNLIDRLPDAKPDDPETWIPLFCDR